MLGVCPTPLQIPAAGRSPGGHHGGACFKALTATPQPGEGPRSTSHFAAPPATPGVPVLLPPLPLALCIPEELEATTNPRFGEPEPGFRETQPAWDGWEGGSGSCAFPPACTRGLSFPGQHPSGVREPGFPHGASPEDTGIQRLCLFIALRDLGAKSPWTKPLVEEAETKNLTSLGKGRDIYSKENHPDLSRLRFRRQYSSRSFRAVVNDDQSQHCRGQGPAWHCPPSFTTGCTQRHRDGRHGPRADPFSPSPCSQGRWHQPSPPCGRTWERAFREDAHPSLLGALQRQGRNPAGKAQRSCCPLCFLSFFNLFF